MYYAGIGSRKTPARVLTLMSKIAGRLEIRGFHLRSGGAVGADTAFENGVISRKNITVYRPQHADAKSIAMAGKFHPAWNRCSQYARSLHARNCKIVLGDNLDSPVNFIVCWTPGGGLHGGTAQAMRVALYHKIKIFNLFGDFNHVLYNIRDYIA